MKRMLFLLPLFLTQTVQADITCPSGLPPDICQFDERVYNDTNFKKTDSVRQTMVQLKELMIKHGQDTPLVQDHLLTLGTQIIEEAFARRAPKEILALADGKGSLRDMLKHLKVWEAKHGPILPLDWQVPEGVSIMIANLERSYDVSTDRTRYGLSIFGSLDHSLTIEQFQVSRPGGEILIDKTSGIGEWHEGIMGGPNLPSAPALSSYPYFGANTVSSDKPLTDGLYLFSMKTKDQPVVKGWFFLRGTPTSSPVVQSPQVNETLTSATPTFRFQDFRSNAILSSDMRKRSVQIYREGTDNHVWKAAMINPPTGDRVTLGQEANQSGVSALEPGAYRLNLSFEERSYFGGITVGRQLNTTVPFRIAK